VPLAATTYYFTSLDELVAAALDSLLDRWLAGARAVLDALPDRVDDAPTLARAVVAAVLGGSVDDDGAVLTMYERFLQAGRSPHLRSVITAYGARMDALLLELLRRGSPCADEGAVRRVLAALDGTALRALAEGRPVLAATTAAVLPLLPVPSSLDDLLEAARTGPPRLTPAQDARRPVRPRPPARRQPARTGQRASQGDLPGRGRSSTATGPRVAASTPQRPGASPRRPGADLEGRSVVCRQGYSSQHWRPPSCVRWDCTAPTDPVEGGGRGVARPRELPAHRRDRRTSGPDGHTGARRGPRASRG
jgi:DNA-binding transcriptional regulator YbjK